METNVRGRNHAGVYKWPFHYHVIRLASKLKSSRLLAKAIGDAFALVGLEPPAQLPTRWTLQRWELKLDIADMVHRRKALHKEVSAGITARRSLSADSSPQAGFTFFCMREERCCIVDGVLREVSSQPASPHIRFAPFQVHRRPSEDNKQLFIYWWQGNNSVLIVRPGIRGFRTKLIKSHAWRMRPRPQRGIWRHVREHGHVAGTMNFCFRWL